MKYSTQTGTPADVKSQCLVTNLSGARRALTRAAARDALARATLDFKNEVGEVLNVGLGQGEAIWCSIKNPRSMRNWV